LVLDEMILDTSQSLPWPGASAHDGAVAAT
jgi:hypothetical protein